MDKDPFFFCDLASAIQHKCNASIRRHIGRVATRRGWAAYPKVKLAKLEEKVKELYCGGSRKEFWAQHRSEILKWARLSVGLNK